MTDELKRILDAQRDAFRSEGPVALETRIDRLNRCIDLIVDNDDELCASIESDFGCRSRIVTRMGDLYTSLNTLKFVRKNLKKWMRPERRRAPFPMGLLGARAEVHYQPKGVVGIMSPWNVPLNMVFSPLADVLGAGNRAMLKPSEFNPNFVGLLQTLVAKYFDETEVAVIAGDAEIGAAFSALPLDHIIFTGSGNVGKLVMQAAAGNLTPVTLELGGKSPVIVSSSADVRESARKVMSIKAINAGQICLSPDYCFVPEESLDEFIAACRDTVNEQFPTIVDNPDFVSMINERNYDRVKAGIEDAKQKGARVIQLGPKDETWDDRGRHRIPLHLVINPSDEMQVMQEELFGPVLCIQSYTTLDACIDDINGRPRPLGLYYLGTDKTEQQRVIDNTISGGMCINDLAIHFACDDLPFGGVGPSGMGQYHGRDGFRTFSHAKAVLKQGRIDLPKVMGTLPPYGAKVEKIMSRMIQK